jgi:hypothetical protein
MQNHDGRATQTRVGGAQALNKTKMSTSVESLPVELPQSNMPLSLGKYVQLLLRDATNVIYELRRGSQYT